MAFDYDKIKDKVEQEGNQWASYSDLFMVLSVVFLLLYVVASLRSGTNSIQKNIEYQQLTQEIDDLKQQLRVYNNLKDGALQNAITKKEQDDYKMLMSQLDLLQNEASAEKDELRKKAEENERKEKALNQYQQMIRNIIDANVIAKSRMEKKDEIIQRKNVAIQDTRQELKEKKQLIKQTNQQVAELEKNLEIKK
ncbi:MAG: microtubule-binding protein, partial [Bdellovibrionales bacterium]|nr:microtubule-binding protein [Bdellovibrionales bacterium]